MTTSALTISFIGGGAMGEAIIAGLVRSGHAPDQIIVADPSQARQDVLTQEYAVRTAASAEAAAQADVVVLAVKPALFGSALEAITDSIEADTLVVSVAAGVTTKTLEEGLPAGAAVVRVMPNTPALIGEGMSALSGGRHTTAEQLQTAEDLMRSCGQAITIAESAQNSVTAVSGSGPAYVFAMIDAMVEGGVLLGLPRDTARELVVQTVYGAAALVKETGEHPAVLRERVSSPGGTTVAALRELDERAVRAAYVAAMEAAAERSAELSGD